MMSQIGYVSAAAGVGLAALLFGEHPSAVLWLSVSLIVLGMRLVAPAPTKLVEEDPGRSKR